MQGKADYIVLGDKGEVEVYINKGTADTSVVGDGIRLADLNGDGFDDYLFLEPDAAVRMYVNNGHTSTGQNWNWVPFDNFNPIVRRMLYVPSGYFAHRVTGQRRWCKARGSTLRRHGRFVDLNATSQ